jgi:hypothetical protein
MLLVGCDLEPPPAAPSFAEQGVQTGGDRQATAASVDLDQAGTRRGDLRVRPSAQLELADGLTVSVIAIEGRDQVRFEVDAPGGAAAFDLTVGEAADVGDHRVELVELADDSALVVVTDASGSPVGPA